MRRLPGATVAGSGYRGVSKASKGMWRAVLWLDGCGRQQYLGQYATPIEAARAYDRAALRTKGVRAVLNFPEEASGYDMSGNAALPASRLGVESKASPTSSAAEAGVAPRRHRASAKLSAKRAKRARYDDYDYDDYDDEEEEEEEEGGMSALEALLVVAQQATDGSTDEEDWVVE